MRCRLGGLFVLVFLLPGCDEKEAAAIRKVSGKALDRASAMLTQAGDAVGLQVDAAKAKWDDWEAPARVRARLHWDKVLEGSSIKVEIENGIVTLAGMVLSEDQRKRAQELAEATIGVRQVTEKLSVVARGTP